MGRIRILSAGVALALVASSASCGSSLPGPIPDGLIVATSRDTPTEHERQLVAVLRSLGFQASTLSADRVYGGAPRAVFFPSTLAKHVTVGEARKLRAAVLDGASVAVEGEHLLAQSVGVALTGDVAQASGGRGTQRYELDAIWTDRVQLARFRVDAKGVFASPEGEPVAAAGVLGKGRFLFLAADVLTKDGQVRYPGLGEMLRSALGMRRPALRRPALEVRFDPATREGVDAEALASMWAARGVQAVHVRGSSGAGRWPYAAFVEELHRLALRAYLWIEPPMATKQVWDANPQCRERTATGSDTTRDWRSLLAIEDPACMKLAVKTYADLVALAPWDGIDVSGLYFEDPASGADRPESYTPLHTSVRRDFAAAHGFDPQLLFDPRSSRFRGKDAASMQAFAAYRTSLVTRLHRDLAAQLRPLLPEGDIVVSVIDAVLDPTVAGNVGMDAAAIAPLSKDFGLRLHVADPFTLWAREPERFADVRDAWDKLAVPYSVELTVIDRETRNPTVRIGGAELARAAAAASDARSVLMVSSESAVLPDDWSVLTAALASRATVAPKGDGFVVRSDSAVLVALPRGWRAAEVDGVAWRLGERGTVLLPPGRHELQRAQALPSGWTLDRTSCELVGGSSRALDLVGTGPCYVRLRGPAPAEWTLDGKAIEPSQWWTSAGGSTLRIPAGKHSVRMS